MAPLAPTASHNFVAPAVVFGLLTLAVTPFIFATPVYATDDNTVSIAVDQNAALKPTGNLYKATTNVTVKIGKPYGFNLTMQADTADLVNSKDSTHKISATPSSTPVALNANQWGYSLSKSATTFSAVPAGAQATPAVVADVTKAKSVGCTNPANCTKSVTFAANVDPAKLASGSYSTAITYTATAKPKPFDWPRRTAKTDPSEVCRSGDNSSSCLVDLDKNMIPVKYTGTITNAQWTSIANPEDEDAKGNWYDYSKKQWANAVTVKNPQEYKGQAKPVKQSDILGFWVYIPRYAYEVMRRDGTDKPVPAQNFDIKFENTKTPPKRPLACKTKNDRDKDYRTQCGVSRELPLEGGEVSTWATHPAFTFGTKKLNELDVPNELNGIWFGKFETTGTAKQPTVLPNEAHMSGGYAASSNIGRMYTTAKTIGVADGNNIGGKTDYTVPAQNNHYLAKLSSHMVNSNDWGAVTYLSASKYGAGYNKVQINASGEGHTTYGKTYGVTGCGPRANGDTSSYGGNNTDNTDFVAPTHTDETGGALGTQSACYSGDIQRAYNGTLGQLASTTNNVYGIYDMAGGGFEYVAASYSDNLNNSNTNQYFGSTAAHPPYVNTYNITNMNSCTFNICGGQALYENGTGTGDGSRYSLWNSQYLYMGGFASSYPWFGRGGYYGGGPYAGLFCTNGNDGISEYYNAFRVALAPLQD